MAASYIHSASMATTAQVTTRAAASRALGRTTVVAGDD